MRIERELLLRVVTAVFLFLAATGWLLYASDPWFQLVLALFAIAATSELLTLLKLYPIRRFGVVTTAVWVYLMLGGGPLPALLGLWLGWGVLALALGRDDAGRVSLPALAMGCWMAFWLLLTVWMVLRLHHRPQGTLFLAGLCLVIWASDIAAYVAGRQWGRRRLAPAISPGKSIEGVVAGVLAALVVGVLFWPAMVGMGRPAALGLALTAAVLGVAGDLMESLLKRTVGVKESGTLLPGHGGLLDRIDALLPGVPVVGLLWLKLVS